MMRGVDTFVYQNQHAKQSIPTYLMLFWSLKETDLRSPSPPAACCCLEIPLREIFLLRRRPEEPFRFRIPHPPSPNCDPDSAAAVCLAAAAAAAEGAAAERRNDEVEVLERRNLPNLNLKAGKKSS